MIDFLSTYAKGIAVCIVIVSILEMLVPDSKSKKYIKTILGIFVIYTIVNPLIKNKEIFDVNELMETSLNSIEVEKVEVNQTSMNDKIKILYIEEIEKDMKQKIEEKGYVVNNINVEARVEEKAEIVGVNIDLNTDNKEASIEEKLVSEINKIKKVNIKNKTMKNTKEVENNKNQNNEFLELKKYISEEYGVDEKCLKIN